MIDPFTITLKIPETFSQNVGGIMYTNPMKKKNKPLHKANEARRKAEAQALFQVMLKAKHSVVIPDNQKGTRAANKRKAIQESY